MENKKYYELDKIQTYINCSLDEKDNAMSTYIYNYARILEAFIKDINDLKNKENNSKAMLEEFDIIDKFKKLVISEADRCVILNRSKASPISNNKSNKENTVSKENVVSDNTIDPNEYSEIAEKIAKNVNKVINEELDKIHEENDKIYEKIYKEIDNNNVTKQKVNKSIKPKTINPKEDYNTINNKIDLSSGYEIYKKSDLSNKIDNNKTFVRDYMANPTINKEENPLDDFEFVAEAFARLISKFNKGDI